MELDLKIKSSIIKESQRQICDALELMVLTITLCILIVTQWDNPFSYRTSLFMGIYSNWKLRISIWTAEGWLVITHGVGAMRRYCIGASLFDLDDPSKEIGRLKNLLSPREDEREGYTQCGLFLRCDYSQQQLNLPYAVSDYSSTYGVVDMLN
jgi:hypothetical protein